MKKINKSQVILMAKRPKDLVPLNRNVRIKEIINFLNTHTHNFCLIIQISHLIYYEVIGSYIKILLHFLNLSNSFLPLKQFTYFPQLAKSLIIILISLKLAHSSVDLFLFLVYHNNYSTYIIQISNIYFLLPLSRNLITLFKTLV